MGGACWPAQCGTNGWTVQCHSNTGALYYCPLFSNCDGFGGCYCYSGYTEIMCNGTACTATTCTGQNKNWWCIP
jgi:hypothetical protein